MKNLIQKITTIMQIFLLTTHVAHADQNNKSSSVSIETYLAAATVETINKLETVENYLNWLAPRISDQEMENLKNYLQSIGVSKKQKFPKLKAFKSRVYFNAEDFMEYHKNQITIEGLNFYQQKMSMDTIVKNIVLRIHKPKTTAWLNLLLPRAHASSSALTSALIGLVAGGALGYFTAPSSGVSTGQSTRTGAILGALTGLGGYYLSQSLSSQLGSGSLYCSGNNYVINGATTQQQVPPGVIVQMYNGPRPCTTARAGYLQSSLQTSYLGSATGSTGHPGTLVDTIQ